MKKFKPRLQKLVLTKKGTINKVYSNALKSIKINDKSSKVYPKTFVKNGRYFNLIDNSSYVTRALRAQGYKYTTGNDAPRGGKEGDFIKMSKPALTLIKKIRNG